MTNNQCFYVPKSTGTLTDTLVAFGLAGVLGDFLKNVPVSTTVTLEDSGGYYIVDTGTLIRDEWIDNAQVFETIPFVTASRFPQPVDLPMLRTKDVDATWDRFKTYVERQKELRAEKVTGAELEQATADWKPESDWTVVTYLGDYRMQAQGIHNDLVERWLRSGEKFTPLNIRSLLALFANPLTNQETIAADWKTATKETVFSDSVTASQLFNPAMGKGQNRSKANKLAMDNEKSFWLLEYLKAVGLWMACAPTATTNANLRKTYVLAPRTLELNYHQRVFARFRERLWNEGAVKQDIKAALLYTIVLLENSIEDDNLEIFNDGGISNVVKGMHVATYQLLSLNSYTTMNLSFLGLPDWMRSINSPQAAADYLDVLQEHLDRIDAIDQERETSDGYSLLQLYRDFVSGTYLEAFFEFLTDYSNYLISAIGKGKFFVRPFSETNLRRLFTMTEPKLSAILEDEGFRNFAAAIRKSTVTPLYRGKQSLYEVRFGIGTELQRHAQYNDKFVQALGDFARKYNDETMRVLRRTKLQYRQLITTNDIEDIVGLIDAYDAKTVCNLLVAFGYARDPRERDEDESNVAGEGAV